MCEYETIAANAATARTTPPASARMARSPDPAGSPVARVVSAALACPLASGVPLWLLCKIGIRPHLLDIEARKTSDQPSDNAPGPDTTHAATGGYCLHHDVRGRDSAVLSQTTASCFASRGSGVQIP